LLHQDKVLNLFYTCSSRRINWYSPFEFFYLAFIIMSHITPLNYTAILQALLEEANYGYSPHTVFFYTSSVSNPHSSILCIFNHIKTRPRFYISVRQQLSHSIYFKQNHNFCILFCSCDAIQKISDPNPHRWFCWS
jgi:hypothetical protein